MRRPRGYFLATGAADDVGGRVQVADPGGPPQAMTRINRHAALVHQPVERRDRFLDGAGRP